LQSYQLGWQRRWQRWRCVQTHECNNNSRLLHSWTPNCLKISLMIFRMLISCDSQCAYNLHSLAKMGRNQKQFLVTRLSHISREGDRCLDSRHNRNLWKL
jgi:hypothetical protein